MRNRIVTIFTFVALLLQAIVCYRIISDYNHTPKIDFTHEQFMDFTHTAYYFGVHSAITILNENPISDSIFWNSLERNWQSDSTMFSNEYAPVFSPEIPIPQDTIELDFVSTDITRPPTFVRSGMHPDIVWFTPDIYKEIQWTVRRHCDSQTVVGRGSGHLMPLKFEFKSMDSCNTYDIEWAAFTIPYEILRDTMIVQVFPELPMFE